MKKRNVRAIVDARVGNINPNYDLSTDEINQLKELHKGEELFFTIVASFVYGYEMGCRATKAKKGGRE